jgi:predicted acyl esterase
VATRKRDLLLAAGSAVAVGLDATISSNASRAEQVASQATAHPARREVKIRMDDGIDIAVALYMPAGNGPFPVLLAASPYRYDNNSLPATPQFLWRETGPVDFYVNDYVYAHMDIRGCGKSGGEYQFLVHGLVR